MKDKNYRVFRENIYVGRLVSTEKVRPIYEFEDNATKEKTIEDDSYLINTSYCPYRTILFTLDEENKANDLLYNSPAYPIINITDNKYFKNHQNESMLIIDKFISMEPLLKHCNFGLVLYYEDILLIKEMFFKTNYVQRHSELFGFRKIDQKRTTVKKDQFSYELTPVLSPEYFTLINELENHTLKDMINGEYTKINSFRPSLKETKVRRLKRK